MRLPNRNAGKIDEIVWRGEVPDPEIVAAIGHRRHSNYGQFVDNLMSSPRQPAALHSYDVLRVALRPVVHLPGPGQDVGGVMALPYCQCHQATRYRFHPDEDHCQSSSLCHLQGLKYMHLEAPSICS